MTEDKLICDLCQSNEKDEIKYGKFYIKNKLKVHYFCLLLTSGLVQNGDDDDGILGFLPKDIIAEKKRVKDKICVYCKRKGANICCCQQKCQSHFHFICGINNGAQNHFLETFQSFCHQHGCYKKLKKVSSKETCSICWENFLQNEPRTNAILTPCCKNGYFHKYCLQEFANKAGYFFKCPLCNDTTVFLKTIPKLGIFIPQKDADWELEPNAFEDLLERPKDCSALSCICKSGRNFTNEGTFKFLVCQVCGAQAIHELCYVKNLKISNGKYSCLDCINTCNKLKLNEYSRDSGVVIIDKSDFGNGLINIEDSDESEENLTDRNKHEKKDHKRITKTSIKSDKAKNFDEENKYARKRKNRIESSSTDCELLKKQKGKKLTKFVLESDCSVVVENNSENIADSIYHEEKTTKNGTQNKNTKNGKFLSSCDHHLRINANENAHKKSELHIEFSKKTASSRKEVQENGLISSSKHNYRKYRHLPGNSKHICEQTSSTSPSCSKFEKCDSVSRKLPEKRRISSDKGIFKNCVVLVPKQKQNKFCLKQNLCKYNDEKFSDDENKRLSSEHKGICSIKKLSVDSTLKNKHQENYNDFKQKVIKEVNSKSKILIRYQNEIVNVQKTTTQRKYLCFADTDSDCSTSSFSRRYYTHNKNVLKKNLKNKLTPINLKIRSKYAKFRKSNKLRYTTRTIQIETRKLKEYLHSK